MVKGCSIGLQELEGGYKGFRRVTRGHKALQGVKGGYSGLQEMTGDYKELQRVTRGYRGLLTG